MQSAQATIDRFMALAGEVDPVEWLTEAGVVTTSIEDAVEARLTKRLKQGGCLTVRVELARLPDLDLGVEALPRTGFSAAGRKTAVS